MPQNTRDYAIIIGVNYYKELRPLNGPIEDATNFRNWLGDSDGGNIPAANIYFIPSTDRDPLKPIKDDIDDALCTIVEGVSEDTRLRRLYFFFAGHGVGIKWDTTGLCLPKWSSVRLNAALSSKNYLDCIVESNLFEEVYFFLDCCRNRKLRANPLHPDLGWPIPGGAECKSVVFYATSFDSYAFEGNSNDEEAVQGYFSKALVNGLKGGAVDETGVITGGKLVDYVRINTAQLARSVNQSQTVDIHVNFKDTNFTDFPLFGERKVIRTTLRISFRQSGDIVVEDPFLNPIKSERVEKDALLELEDLSKGIYSIRDNSTGIEKQVRIDGTLTEMDYEF